MLFKNATVFGAVFGAGMLDVTHLPVYEPATPGALRSEGFSPVYEGALEARHSGHILLKYTIEKKVMPKPAIDAVLRARALEMEDEQGFYPGKKALKDLRERVFDELLPRALSVPRSCWVWIDTVNNRLIVDSTTVDTVDSVTRALLKAVPKLDLRSVQAWPGVQAMTDWVMESGEHVPVDFTIDDDAKLEKAGEKGTVITFKKGDLFAPEFEAHIGHGARITSLAMTYKDRVSFVMTPNGSLRRLRGLDILKEAQAVADADAFVNDFMLAALETSALIDAVEALA